MTVAMFQSREQALAGGLAFVMHVLFLVLLVFGVSWQHKQIDSAVVVDLWRDVPAAAPSRTPPPEPAVKPEPKPEPPPPAPKVEAKPQPKPEPAPAAKPDIALKEKLEKERKLKEQAATDAKKRAEEKAREAEAEKKKRAEADALKKKQAADAEAKRVANEQARAQEALAAQQAAAQKREIDKYMDGIRSEVKPNVRVPAGTSAKSQQAEFDCDTAAREARCLTCASAKTFQWQHSRLMISLL